MTASEPSGGGLRAEGAWLLEMTGTHLYPGAGGRIAAEGAGEDGAPAVVLFADGGRAAGRISAWREGAAILGVGAHVTARGTRIPQKRWRVGIAPGHGDGTAEGETTVRVIARLRDGG